MGRGRSALVSRGRLAMKSSTSCSTHRTAPLPMRIGFGKRDSAERDRAVMRMEALSLRLGVQGQAGRPRCRVRSTPAVRPGPGEPAVADGLRYAAVSESAPTGRTVAAGPTALTWMTSPTRRRGTSSSGRSRIRNGCGRARRGNRSPSGLRVVRDGRASTAGARPRPARGGRLSSSTYTPGG